MMRLASHCCFPTLMDTEEHQFEDGVDLAYLVLTPAR